MMIKKVIRVCLCLLTFFIWQDLFLYANQKFFNFTISFKDIFTIYIIALALIGVMFQVFSTLNTHKLIPYLKKQFSSVPTVGILINAKSIKQQIFKECLLSLKKQNYQQIYQIIIINHQIGNAFVENVFNFVFPQGKCISLQKNYIHMSEQEKTSIKNFVNQNQYLCLNNTNMIEDEYLTLTALSLFQSQTELILVSDSNSVWKLGSVQALVQVMGGHDSYRIQQNRNQMSSDNSQSWIFSKYVKECGAVFPKQQTQNIFNYFSFLQYVKNQTKNQIQKGCLSYFGISQNFQSMSGLYKKKVLFQIHQKSVKNMQDLSMSTIFSQILELNWITLYNHNASVYLQNAKNLFQWILEQEQQLKLVIKKNLKNLKNFNKSIYHLYKSFLLLWIIFSTFFSLVCVSQLKRNGINFIMLFSVFVVSVSLIKALFGVLKTFKLYFVHLCSYNVLNSILLFPSYVLTVLTFDIQQQQNTMQKQCEDKIKMLNSYYIGNIFICVVITLGTFIYSYTFILDYILLNRILCEKTLANLYFICLIVIFGLLIHWNTWGIFWYLPKQQQKLLFRNSNKQKTENEKKQCDQNSFLKQKQNKVIQFESDELQRGQEQGKLLNIRN